MSFHSITLLRLYTQKYQGKFMFTIVSGGIIPADLYSEHINCSPRDIWRTLQTLIGGRARYFINARLWIETNPIEIQNISNSITKFCTEYMELYLPAVFYINHNLRQYWTCNLNLTAPSGSNPSAAGFDTVKLCTDMITTQDAAVSYIQKLAEVYSEIIGYNMINSPAAADDEFTLL